MVESEKPSSAEESAEESGLDGGVDSAEVFCVEDDREDSEVDSILLLRVLGRSLVRILLWGMLIKLVGWIMRQILWSAASVEEVGEDLEEAYSTVEFKGSCVQDYGGSSARIPWLGTAIVYSDFQFIPKDASLARVALSVGAATPARPHMRPPGKQWAFAVQMTFK